MTIKSKNAVVVRTIERVISIVESTIQSEIRNSDALAKYEDFKFCPVYIVGEQPEDIEQDLVNALKLIQKGYVLAIAPKGDDHIVTFEYEVIPGLSRPVASINLYNTETKIEISRGDIIYPLNLNEKVKEYTVMSLSKRILEIKTELASERVISRTEMFTEYGTIKVGSVPITPVNKPAKEKFVSTYKEPIEFAMEEYPIFSLFIKRRCNNDLSVTNVSDCLCEYLRKRKVKIKHLARKFKMPKAILYNIASVRNLHQTLRPMTNISRKSQLGKKRTRNRISLEVAGLLSRVALDKQVALWNKVKNMYSLWMIKEIRKNIIHWNGDNP